MEFASIIIATASAIISIVTFFVTVGFEKRKITIRAINLLQNEVLDKFVFVKKDNVKFVVENLEDEKCRKTYDEYRTLVARLEHFAVGVNKRIYNYGIVKVLLGNHLIFLYNKVSVIINEANKHEKHTVYYCNFEKLVKRLKTDINSSNGK